MAFISICILFFSGCIEWADLICLSGVGQPKFCLHSFLIKSVHFNSFTRLSKKKNKSRRKVKTGVSYTGILTRDEY